VPYVKSGQLVMEGLSMWRGHAKALPLPRWIPDKRPFFSLFPCVYANKVTAVTYLMSVNVLCHDWFLSMFMLSVSFPSTAE
jgi:hypothetical protein